MIPFSIRMTMLFKAFVLTCMMMYSALSVPNYWACQQGQEHEVNVERYLPYCNASLDVDLRLEDLLQRLTLEEKVKMLSPDPALGDTCATHTSNVSRLGLPPYLWLVEANSGVQAACIQPTSPRNNTSSLQHAHCATQFSGPLTMAASFNRTAWRLKGLVMGVEQRAFVNLHGHKGSDSRDLLGLHAYGPNINQQRDARFGRSSELPGEDPYLSGQYALYVVRGMQTRDEDHQRPLVLAYLKHFAAYNRETDRGKDDYNISLYDLFDSYLPQYEMALRGTRQGRDPHDGDDDSDGATGVMCSYNGINGRPACANGWLLNTVLRQRWQLPWAHVTTDCNAIASFLDGPPASAPDGPTAAAWALMNGTDLEMGSTVWREHLVQAVRDSSFGATESALDEALRRSYRPHFELGRFDSDQTSKNHLATSPELRNRRLLRETRMPQPKLPSSWTRLGLEHIRFPYHEDVRLEAALQGLVLLKHNHSNPVLPLNQYSPRRCRLNTTNCTINIAVLGPLSHTREGLLSDYANSQTCPRGRYDCIPTVVESFREYISATKQGTRITLSNASGVDVDSLDTAGIEPALKLMNETDVVILCLGITREQEHENLDRNDTALPGLQRMFAYRVFDTAVLRDIPVVLVLINGGQVALDDISEGGNRMWLVDGPATIIEAFNPNDIGGKALTMSLFGADGANRWGKLPYTIYPYTVMQSFDMMDHDMTKPPGRTYRYFTGQPIFPFGYGLSLTTFRILNCTLPHHWLSVSSYETRPSSSYAELSCEVSNTGPIVGDEVIQVYHRFDGHDDTMNRSRRPHPFPLKRLVEFERVRIEPGKKKRVSWHLDLYQTLALVNEDGNKVVYPGNHSLLVTNGVQVPKEVKAKVV